MKDAIKKTISVKKFVDEINRRNKLSTCEPNVRNGWNDLLEFVLRETNQYNGFGYLQQHEVPQGQLPGIIKNLEDPEKNTYPDDSRKVYYMKRS